MDDLEVISNFGDELNKVNFHRTPSFCMDLVEERVHGVLIFAPLCQIIDYNKNGK